MCATIVCFPRSTSFFKLKFVQLLQLLIALQHHIFELVAHCFCLSISKFFCCFLLEGSRHQILIGTSQQVDFKGICKKMLDVCNFRYAHAPPCATVTLINLINTHQLHQPHLQDPTLTLLLAISLWKLLT